MKDNEKLKQNNYESLGAMMKAYADTAVRVAHDFANAQQQFQRAVDGPAGTGCGVDLPPHIFQRVAGK